MNQKKKKKIMIVGITVRHNYCELNEGATVDLKYRSRDSVSKWSPLHSTPQPWLAKEPSHAIPASFSPQTSKTALFNLPPCSSFPFQTIFTSASQRFQHSGYLSPSHPRHHSFARPRQLLSTQTRSSRNLLPCGGVVDPHARRCSQTHLRRCQLEQPRNVVRINVFN